MPTTAPTAPTAEPSAPVCAHCDRESRHFIKQVEPDNTVHYVCWDCLYRREKRINVQSRFKRPRRA